MNAPRLDLSKTPGQADDRQSSVIDGRTWAEISLKALGENFHAVQKHVGKAVTICAVVKADGYGHGAVECARGLESEGAEWLGVTNAAEGLALRDCGVNTRILFDDWNLGRARKKQLSPKILPRPSGKSGTLMRSNAPQRSGKPFCRSI